MDECNALDGREAGGQKGQGSGYALRDWPIHIETSLKRQPQNGGELHKPQRERGHGMEAAVADNDDESK